MKNGRFKPILLMLLVCFSAVFFAACSCTSKPIEKDIPVTGLVISVEQREVAVGDSFTIEYTIAPTNSTITGVYIRSSNHGVAAIDKEDSATNSGVVTITAKKAGVAEISFIAKHGEFTKVCLVQVFQTAKLSVPTGVTIENGAIQWQGVSTDVLGNARTAPEKYAVKVTTNTSEQLFTTHSNVVSSADFKMLAGVEYAITVQALGDDNEVRNYDSDISPEYKFYQLTAPQFDIVNGVVNWGDYYKNNSQLVLPNYYILTYSEDGSQYEIIYNAGDVDNNWYDLKEKQLDEYHVTLRAVYLDMPQSEGQEVIGENYQVGNVSKGMVEGVTYIESPVSTDIIVHTVKQPHDAVIVQGAPTTMEIDGVDINRLGFSVLKWQSGEASYINRIKHDLTFYIDDKSVTFSVAEGVLEFEFNHDNLTEIFSALQLTTTSPEFFVEIKAQFADPERDKALIMPVDGVSFEFSYYPTQPADLNLQFNAAEFTLAVDAPMLERFESLQFVLVNKQTKRMHTVSTTTTEVDISMLNSAHGSFNIYVFVQGREGVVNSQYINLDALTLHKLTLEDVKVVFDDTDDNYYITWKNNEMAAEYVITGEQEITISAEEDGYYLNTQTNMWRYPLPHPDDDDVNHITIVAKALENDENNWYIDSNQVKFSVTALTVGGFTLSGGRIEWQLSAHVNRLDNYTVEVGQITQTENNYFDASSLAAGEHTITVTANSVLAVAGSDLYVLSSQEKAYSFTKLNTVTVTMIDGRIGWERTVEGMPSESAGFADNYDVYIDDVVVAAHSTEQGGYFWLTLAEGVAGDTTIAVVVRRDGFISSHKSAPLSVTPIEVPTLEKQGDNLTFAPAKLAGDTDVAWKYVLTGEGLNQEISSQDLQDLTDGKYVVALDNDFATAGAYTYTLKVYGRLMDEVAYLPNSQTSQVVVIRLNSPAENHLTVVNGGLQLTEYAPASTNAADLPLDIKVTLYKDGVVYKTPLTIAYSSLSFSGGKATLVLAELELGSGDYQANLQYIGNGNTVLDSTEQAYQFAKLNTVSITMVDGRIGWQRTVEGLPSDSPQAATDSYDVYINDVLVVVQLTEQDSYVWLTLAEGISVDSSIAVVVLRDGFIPSDKSAQLSVQPLAVPTLAKDGNNLTFAPAKLVQGADVAWKYVITTMQGNIEVLANGEYLVGQQYQVPIADSFSQPGEYVFELQVFGSIVDNVAYLPSNQTSQTVVVRLNNPAGNQLTVVNGGLQLKEYTPAVANGDDRPTKLEVTFYQGESVYKTAQTYNYNDFNFVGGVVQLHLPNAFLEEGTYQVKLKFIGNGNTVLDSQQVLADTVAKKLAKVAVYIEDGQLKWTEIASATYRVYVNSETQFTVIDEYQALNVSNWAASTEIYVQAYAADWLLGEMSDKFTAIKLVSPYLQTGEQSGNKQLKWDGQLGVTAYTIFKPNQQTERLGVVQAWTITKDQPAGRAMYTIMAHGTADSRLEENSTQGYLDSNKSQEIGVEFIAQTREVTYTNGVLAWEGVSGVLDYQVVLSYISEEQPAEEIITTNKTSLDFHQHESLPNGKFTVTVKIGRLAEESGVVISHEGEAVTTVLLKINQLSTHNMYEDARVQDGIFAYSITNAFLDEYKTLLVDANPENADVYNDLTMQSLIDVLDKKEPQLVEIFRPLITFNVFITHQDNNDIIKTNKTPTYYKEYDEGVVLYYEVNGPHGVYSVRFQPVGNSVLADDVVGVMGGGKTTAVAAVLPSRPVSPTAPEGKSIIDGVLIFAYPAYPQEFNGEFVIQFTNTNNNQKVVQTITVSDNPQGPWEAKLENSLIKLDLKKCVTENLLEENVSYAISLYAKGTLNSLELNVGDPIYINGEVLEVEQTFEVLSAPDLKVDKGDLAWNLVERAVGYELTLSLHNGTEYQHIKTLQLPVDAKSYSFKDVAELPHGNYQVELRAKGNGENLVNSTIAKINAIKLGSVEQIVIDDGMFCFEEVTYQEILSDGTTSTKTADNYVLLLIERTGGVPKDGQFIDAAHRTKVGNKWYIELPDAYNLTTSDYSIAVYVGGNNVMLLSGDTVQSGYYMRSVAPVDFKIDSSGQITWEGGEPYYAVYIGTSRVTFEDSQPAINGDGYTDNKAFSINQYLHVFNYSFNQPYNIYVRAKKDNSQGAKWLRSPKSQIFILQTMEMPIVQIENGQLNWQSTTFEDIAHGVSQAYLTIAGNFSINGELQNTKLTVKCSAEAVYLKNISYIVESRDGEYYMDMKYPLTEGATLSLIDGNQYAVTLQYIGSVGGMLGDGKTNFVTSDVWQGEGFTMRGVPQGLVSLPARQLEVEHANNFIAWEKQLEKEEYIIYTYVYKDNQRILVKAYNLADYATSNLLGEKDMEIDGVMTRVVYFAADHIALHFASLNYEEKVTYEIVAKGVNWHGGTGDKILSSLPSQPLEVIYPQSPGVFEYDGKGTISWDNRSDGDIVIEIKYLIHDEYIHDLEGYQSENIFAEITSRELEQEDGVYTNYIVDTIVIRNQQQGRSAYYQLRYLTEEIVYVKIKTELKGLMSTQLTLSVDDNLSQGHALFSLFNGGNGTEQSPFTITTATQLYNINYYLSSYFKLDNNIALTGKWAPIGSSGTAANKIYKNTLTEFTGGFDGGGYTISNINLNSTDETAVGRRQAGVFYSLGEIGVIQNVTLDFNSLEVSNTGQNNLMAGALVAYQNKGRIQDVMLKGSLVVSASDNTASKTYVAGIAYENTGEILDCISQLNLKETKGRESYVGGIVAINRGTLSRLGVESTLSGTVVGGIAAINYSQIIECYFVGWLEVNSTVYSGEYSMGGIAGIANTHSGKTSTILRSYAVISATVNNAVNAVSIGGLIGSSAHNSTQLKFSYARIDGYLTTRVNNIGYIYGAYTSGGVDGVYYLEKVSGIKGVTGVGLITGVNRSENNLALVDAINTRTGDTVFRMDVTGLYPVLTWQE